MIITEIKRRYHITTVQVPRDTPFLPIEIRLPSNMVKLTGALAMCSLVEGVVSAERRLGTVRLQAMDSTDIFHVAEVHSPLVLTDDYLLMTWDQNFYPNQTNPWFSGCVPQLQPLDVSGDNAFIMAWLRVENFAAPFTLRIYIQYELPEQLVSVQHDDVKPSAPPQPAIL